MTKRLIKTIIADKIPRVLKPHPYTVVENRISVKISYFAI